MLNIHLIQLGAVLHFGILIASALVPATLDWRRELNKLPTLLRHLIWVHGVFIVLVIIAFGTISLFLASSLADGSPLARAFAGFIAVFWLARLGVQFFLFDAKAYLKTPVLLIGYHALTVVFAALVLIYANAAVGAKGVAL
jgi:hypothetical protein